MSNEASPNPPVPQNQSAQAEAIRAAIDRLSVILFDLRNLDQFLLEDPDALDMYVKQAQLGLESVRTRLRDRFDKVSEVERRWRHTTAFSLRSPALLPPAGGAS